MNAAQSALYQSRMQIGRAFGVGGALWSYYTVSGDTVTSASVTTLAGTRALYVIQSTAERLGIAQPGQPVGVVAFQLNAPVDTDVAAGGYIQSQADTSLVFAIGPLDTLQGFPTAIVERAALPSYIAPASLRASQGLRIGAQIGMN